MAVAAFVYIAAVILFGFVVSAMQLGNGKSTTVGFLGAQLLNALIVAAAFYLWQVA